MKKTQLNNKLLVIFISVTISIMTVVTVKSTQAQTISWRWEATVYQAGFNSAQTIPLPWEISVGDIITGTFKINYSDEGYERDPGIKVYELQPIDNVTANIGGVELWLDNYTIHTNIIVDDQPIFNPDFENIAVSRFGRGDPRFPNVAVDGSVHFSNHPSITGKNLIQNAEIPLELKDFENAGFGLFIGETDPDISYSLSARLNSLTQIQDISIDAILTFFDQSVADGTIEGYGHGNSANKRLDSLRNKLLMASDLIEIGDIDGACVHLDVASEKCDGVTPPPDFVTGDSTTTLHDMILELMADLGCE